MSATDSHQTITASNTGAEDPERQDRRHTDTERRLRVGKSASRLLVSDGRLSEQNAVTATGASDGRVAQQLDPLSSGGVVACCAGNSTLIWHPANLTNGLISSEHNTPGQSTNSVCRRRLGPRTRLRADSGPAQSGLSARRVQFRRPRYGRCLRRLSVAGLT